MANIEKKKRVIREFGLSNLALKNRTSVNILIFIIVIMGAWAYSSMPKEAFPEVIMPEIYIGTSHPGNSPLDMENLITRPIETEVKGISDVDKVTSTSIQDYSTIIVKFQAEVETKDALQEVKDAVDRAMKDLPTDLDRDPNIFAVNFSDFPVMNINLSGDYSNDELKEFAEYLEEEIEQLPEISEVDLRGLQEREVKIEVDIHRMAAVEISFRDIEDAIRGENITISGGNVLVDDFRRTIRVIGEFSRISEIENVIVKFEKQKTVYLKDIATVSFDFAERVSYARSSEQPVVSVDVVKKGGENLIIAAQKIGKIMDHARQEVFPEDLEISVTNDQSKQTVNMVSNLENSIISGVILVVLVLLFFLGTRNALFVGLAIPLSMFMAFFVLDSMGITMNMMVLFSSIMALGMLVDNGIVVVENIYRLMDEGYPPIKAAREGVGEVALPIIASTGTTLAAFLPLALWPGMMGEFMWYLPLGLMIILTSSLFVATVINPVLTSRWMRIGTDMIGNKRRLLLTSLSLITVGLLFYVPQILIVGNVLIIAGLLILLNIFILIPGSRKFQHSVMPKLERAYARLLTVSLKHAGKLFVGIILMLFSSFVMLGVFAPNVLFFPINQPHYVNIFIEKPIGTDIEETNRFAKKIEAEVLDLLDKKGYMPIVDAVIGQVGEGTSDPMMGVSIGITPNKARITVSFKEIEDRGDISSSDVMDDIRKRMKGYPGVQITVDQDPAGPPVGKDINIEIVGENFDKLAELAEKMKKFIVDKNIAGVEELKTDLETGKPELIVDIDRGKARRFGVSSGRIGSELRTALFGKEISKFKQGEDDYPIQLRLAERYRHDVNSLMNQKVTFRDQSNGKISQVPISAVATSNLSSTYGSVKRKNLDRMVTLYSNVLSGYNPTQVVENIKVSLEDYQLPTGYYFKFTGQQEEQAKEMAFLTKALAIAVIIIFLIIVSQFNSLGIPFIIMGSVVFSTIGVFLGLLAFQMDFIIIMTMMGIISLAGVVVNNAIVLLDYTGLVIARKRKELGLKASERLSNEDLISCIIQGGKTRLRPVILTAITTILGLLPLAVGMNINFFTLLSDLDPQFYFGGDNVIFWGPMSWTIIFGLSFATFLTLVIVSVMYLLKHRLARRLSPSSAR